MKCCLQGKIFEMTAKNGKMMELLPMLSMQRQLGLEANDEQPRRIFFSSCFLITGTPRACARADTHKHTHTPKLTIFKIAMQISHIFAGQISVWNYSVALLALIADPLFNELCYFNS